MHTKWTDLLSPYLDDELEPAQRRDLEAHLAGCAECRTILADLRRVVAWGEQQRALVPARDPWPLIQQRIGESKVVELPGAGRVVRRFGWKAMIAASLLVATATGVLMWSLTRTGTAGNPLTDLPASTTNAAAGSPELGARELQELLASGRSQLDSATVRVIEESLALIDRAIADAELAIQRDSSNTYLSNRLAAHTRRKLAILRMASRAMGAES